MTLFLGSSSGALIPHPSTLTHLTKYITKYSKNDTYFLDILLHFDFYFFNFLLLLLLLHRVSSIGHYHRMYEINEVIQSTG